MAQETPVSGTALLDFFQVNQQRVQASAAATRVLRAAAGVPALASRVSTKKSRRPKMESTWP
jgi:hypothetical protein